MNRRDFSVRSFAWIASSSLLLANQRSFGSVSRQESAKDKAGPTKEPVTAPVEIPALKLKKICDITFEIAWDVPYGEDDTVTPMSPEHKAKLQAVSDLRAQIWSSQEFKDAVEHFAFWKSPDTAEDVYAQITSVKQKHVKYTLELTDGESASTNGEGVTHIPKEYLESEYGNATNLVNTLSHEYTHLLEARPKGPESPRKLPGFGYTDVTYNCSKVLWWTSGRPNSVPYGIGCITQQIAFPGTPCGDGCGFW